VSFGRHATAACPGACFAHLLRRLVAVLGFTGLLGPLMLVALPVVTLAADRLQLVPDDDRDLTLGLTAYQARDARKAAEYFRKAAERNQRTAQFNLAVLLLSGDGVPADPPQGLRWLRKAADNGMARAQHVEKSRLHNFDSSLGFMHKERAMATRCC
jgi:hypothetical protein